MPRAKVYAATKPEATKEFCVSTGQPAVFAASDLPMSWAFAQIFGAQKPPGARAAGFDFLDGLARPTSGRMMG